MEFEPVDVSTAKVKSLGGQYFVKAFKYIKSHPGQGQIQGGHGGQMTPVLKSYLESLKSGVVA